MPSSSRRWMQECGGRSRVVALSSESRLARELAADVIKLNDAFRIRSRRNWEARKMCLVFLNAMGSYDILIADCESE